MKTKSVLILPTLALLLGLAVFSTPARAADSKLTSKDTTFVTDASEAGATEIDASNMAIRSSSNADVKSLAEMMVKDHTKAAAELEKIATSKGGEPSKSPGVKQKASLLVLKAETGETFNKGFAKMMVKDHKEAVALFEKASTDSDDADLKAFAKATLPTLQHHLKMAEELAKKLGVSE